MSDDEYETELSVWAIMSSPLIVAADVRMPTPVQRRLLLNEALVHINQRYFDGDAGAFTGTHSNCASMFVKRLSKHHAAVVAANLNSKKLCATRLPLGDVLGGGDGDGDGDGGSDRGERRRAQRHSTLVVVDVWRQQLLDVTRSDIVFLRGLAPHQSRTLLVLRHPVHERQLRRRGVPADVLALALNHRNVTTSATSTATATTTATTKSPPLPPNAAQQHHHHHHHHHNINDNKSNYRMSWHAFVTIVLPVLALPLYVFCITTQASTSASPPPLPLLPPPSS